MKITPKEITIQPAKIVSLNNLDYPFITADNPKVKQLRVKLNDRVMITIDGVDYENLGKNWDDDVLLNFIISKYNIQTQSE